MAELFLDTERALHIDSKALIGVRIGVFGSSGSGKSNTVARLIEQIAPFMQGGTFFDFHDEAHGLMAKIPMLRVGKNPPTRKGAKQRSPMVQMVLNPDNAADFAEQAYMKRLAVIVNVAYMDEEERQQVVLNYCQRIWDLAMAYANPYWVVLEEAHNFIPQRTVTEELDLMRRFAAEGRKFGITPILASQRTSKVNKDILSECDYLFLHRINIEHDQKAYRGLLPTHINRERDRFITMEAGEAVVKWWDNGNARFDQVRVCRRDTVHIGATPGRDDGDEPLPTLQTVDMATLGDMGIKPAAKPQPVADETGKPVSVSTMLHRLADIEAQYQHVNALQTLMIIRLASRRQPAVTVATPVPIIEAPAPFKAKPSDNGHLMTEGGIAKQERAFNGLLRDVVRGCKYPFHITILKYLVEREDITMCINDIARFVGLSEQTVRDHPPLYLCTTLALLSRTKVGGVFYYRSSARETLTERFPDLNTDDLISKLLEVKG